VNEYGDLEAILAHAGEIRQPKRRENLLAHADAARMSKRLVTLRRDVPLDVPLKDLRVREPTAEALIGFLIGLELTTLTRRIASELGVEAAGIEAAGVAPQPRTPPVSGAPEAAAGLRVEPPSQAAFGPYETVTGLDRLEHWIARARGEGRLALHLVSTPSGVAGLALAISPGTAAWLPLATATGGELELGDRVDDRLGAAQAYAALKSILEDGGVLKIGHDVKRMHLQFARAGIALAPVDDVMLLSYVLDSGRHGHDIDSLAGDLPGFDPALTAMPGGRRDRLAFDRLSGDDAARIAGGTADVLLRSWEALRQRLAVQHKVAVYETLERPMVAVLAAMEAAGVMVDRTVLARLSQELGQKAAALEGEVHALAGYPFNIGSPKQLGDVLFGKLQLSGGKKTATGARSTDSDVLEEMAAQGIEIARKVLDWRQLTKLKSTYTDALPLHIDPATGRVHTSYSLAATSTGRLSSTEPNLQNIPVRTDEGRKIRTAFVAVPGSVLISADYSQIELRVLAHVADIPQLRQAFVNGDDIHAITASEMFGVPVEGMDPMVRRRAKAINFGIIYGISAFGLANQLSIPREEAAEYIKTYFRRFPGIRDYMDHVKQFVKQHGYIETVFGRRLWFPRISSPNPSERAFQERAAINAPIQGAAADIIRRAMIRIPDALAQSRLSARMLLQVHDELIFEAPAAEAEATMAVVRRVMEKAPEPAVRFGVPIQVDARAASNWEEAH
jgi:DNA polymerase-1